MSNFFVPLGGVTADRQENSITCNCARTIAQSFVSDHNTEQNILIFKLDSLRRILERAEQLEQVEAGRYLENTFIGGVFAKVQHAGDTEDRISIILFPVVKEPDGDPEDFESYDFYDNDRENVDIILETWIDPQSSNVSSQQVMDRFFPADASACPDNDKDGSIDCPAAMQRAFGNRNEQ